MRLRRTFLWVFLSSLGLAAAAGVYALFVPHGPYSGEIVATTMLMGAYGFVTLMAAIVLERRRFVPLMWVGVGAATICAACVLYLIWRPLPSAGDVIARTAFVAAVVAAWATHFGLIWLPGLQRRVARIARLLTTVCTVALAMIAIALIIDLGFVSLFESSTTFQSLTGSLAVVACAGSIAVPVLRRVETLQRSQDEERTIGQRPQIALTCPRCGAQQTVRAGKSRCERCRLGFTIEVEEPRCACGYLLYGVPSDRCPECGAAIPPDKRWSPPAAVTPAQ